jgi:hypothetical protein
MENHYEEPLWLLKKLKIKMPHDPEIPFRVST